MNSKQDKLFVKRNVNFNNTIYSDFEYKHNKPINAISHMNGDPWVGSVTRTAHEKVSEKRDEEAFHNQLKPLLILLRALGCFPVDFPTTGVPRYRALSPVLAYSVCLYVMVNISSYFSIRDGVLLLFENNASFGDCIFKGNMLLTLVNCFCVPVLAWLDTPTVVQYFKKFEQFQVMFVEVTEEHLTLNIKRRCIYCAIFNCVLDSTVFIVHFIPPRLELWQLPCYFVCFLVMNTTICFFGSVFRGLFTSATILNTCFKRDMRQRKLSAYLIGKYRILWLRWSQLVSQVGCMMGRVFGLYLLLILLQITVSLYGFLSGLKGKQVDFVRVIQTAIPCLCSISVLYYFCNYAHRFSHGVGVEIRDELQLAAPSEVTEDVSQEVNMFLETIVMNPPVVSVAGFANVDRGLFRAYASTIVTYMIVMVQFDQSDYSGVKCRGNETHQIT